MYVGGAANHRGSGVGLVLLSPKKIIIEKSLRLDFSVTNNEAEYEALLVGMTIVQKMGGKVVEIFSYSRLVVGQIQGELEAKDMRMQEYLSQVRHLQVLSLSIYNTFIEVETPIPILWPCSQPPQYRAYLGSSLLKLTSYEGRLSGFGYPRTKNCTNALSLGRTCCAYTLRHQSCF